MDTPITLTQQAARKIGKYTLVRLLGQGGMGVVYEAVDRALKRPVAIKLIPAQPDLLARFLREARTAARIRHPNVVAVYDVGRTEDFYYLVMELVEGVTAHALVVHRPLPWTEAVNVIAAITRGLAAAHDAGLIHRDIKPANILCPSEGEPQLADFGLAKPTGEIRSELTQDKAINGTPEYMSPEQCRGEELDERSDIYSLGVTFFQLLTGQPPYLAYDRFKIMFMHCSDPVPNASDLNPEVPVECSAVIRKCMAKRRSDRYASCDELLHALKGVLNLPDVDIPDTVPMMPPLPPMRKRSRRYWLLVPIVFVGLAVSVGLANAWGDKPVHEEPARAPVLRPQLPELEFVQRMPPVAGRENRIADHVQVAFLPDGSGFVAANGGRRLLVRREASAPWDIELPGEIRSFAIGDGGKWAAVGLTNRVVLVVDLTSGGTLGRLDIGGAVAESIAIHQEFLAVASTNGVAYYDMTDVKKPQALWIRGLDGGNHVPLKFVRFSSDGRTLFGFTAKYELEVFDVPTRASVKRVKLQGIPNDIASSSAESQILLQQVEEKSRFHTVDSHGLRQSVAGPEDVTALSVIPKSSRLLFAGHRRLGVFDPNDGTVQVFPPPHSFRSLPIRSLEISPIGRMIVCGYADGTIELWRIPESLK